MPKNQINNLTRIWTEDLNSNFSKEDIPMDNRHMERCSASRASEKCKLKPTVQGVQGNKMAAEISYQNHIYF